MIEKEDAQDFFERYAQALLSRDGSEIARYWAVPSLVVSDAGAIAVDSNDMIVQFFSSSMEQYAGIEAVKPTITTYQPISSSTAFCAISWQHGDADGRPVGEEFGGYILRRDEGAIRIYGYMPRTL